MKIFGFFCVFLICSNLMAAAGGLHAKCLIIVLLENVKGANNFGEKSKVAYVYLLFHGFQQPHSMASL